MKIQHGTQIVYPKDIGYIIARAGIGSGQKILEIGTGSGSLTSFVASVVKPRGHVYTFDVDDTFMKIAEKNIKKAGMSKYVTQQKLDLKTSKKLPVEEADVALIDLGDPWTVLPQVRKMLKGSGAIFAICPTMNQLEKLTIALVENEFTDIESTEHIIRTIEAREGKTRHSFQGIGHTTYLCYARKAFFGRSSRKKSDSSIAESEIVDDVESDAEST
jgi:tRNA (adenine57-N1/adenine58-N1)-methyltransferase